MARYRGYMPMEGEPDVRAIPLSDIIRGVALKEDPQVFGPAMDFTGRSTDTMMAEHSRGLMDREVMTMDEIKDEINRNREAAHVEFSHSRQDEIINQIQQLMAEHQVNSQKMLARDGLMPNGIPLSTVGGETSQSHSMLPGSLNAGRSSAGRSNPDNASIDGMSFGSAFKLARSSGAKIFTWRGRQYTTQLRK